MMLKVKLKSLDKTIIENYLKTLKNVEKIIALPKKIKKYTLQSSPHVNKKAREQYELHMYNYTIYVNSFFFIEPSYGISYKIIIQK